MFIRPTLVVVVLAGAGCTNTMSSAAPALPTAVLACPDKVDVGADFVVDGSRSHVDGSLAQHTLTLSEDIGGGAQVVVDDVKTTQKVLHDAVITAQLSITDDRGNTALAVCRFIVGAPAIDRPTSGEEEPVPTEPDPTTDPTTDPSPDDGAEHVPGVPANIDGNFVLVAYDAARVSVPFALMPAEQCAPAKTVALVTVHQTGRHIAMSAKTCTVEMPAVTTLIGAQISTLSDNAVRALPPLMSEFELAYGEIGDHFNAVRTPHGQVVGAELDDTQALPTSSTDASVRDSDADNLPGVSMRTLDGDGNFVDDHEITLRRTVRTFRGVIVSNDEIDGSAPGSWEVDGDTSLLDDWADSVAPSTVGDPSTFKMTRTTALRCRDLDMAALPAPPPPDFGECAVFGQTP